MGRRARAAPLQDLPEVGFGYVGNASSPDAQACSRLAGGSMASLWPEERRKRSQPSAIAWIWQLPHELGVDAPHEAGSRSAGPHEAHRRG